MAERTIYICDYPQGNGEHCGKEATGRVQAGTDDTKLSGDYCDEHQGILFAEFQRMGMTFSSMKVGKRDRDTYTARSGRPFTTAQAREWLVSEGHTSRGTGRLSKRLLDLYAEQH